MTRAQKQHAKEQRAILALRKAAVRYSLSPDPLAFADLTAACDRYTELLPLRVKRKLVDVAKLVRESDKGEHDEATAAIASMIGGRS